MEQKAAKSHHNVAWRVQRQKQSKSGGHAQIQKAKVISENIELFRDDLNNN